MARRSCFFRELVKKMKKILSKLKKNPPSQPTNQILPLQTKQKKPNQPSIQPIKKAITHQKNTNQNPKRGSKPLALTVDTFLSLQCILYQKSSNPQTKSPHPRKLPTYQKIFKICFMFLVFLQCLHFISSHLSFLSSCILRCFLLHWAIAGALLFSSAFHVQPILSFWTTPINPSPSCVHDCDSSCALSALIF